ncbi:MAG TPA: 50S ribosomal protein L18 [Candidatus Paceibacterota bacterium]|nr:50S ribosomal protein L18 [Candidatus Paceibacterota bacterium]
MAQRARRQKRIRAKVKGTAERPRISVFKSNTAVVLQLIDDTKGATLAMATTRGGKGKTLVERSLAAGKDLASKAKAQKIEAVVFDRGGYIYTGAIKAAAEGAREGGLKF